MNQVCYIIRALPGSDIPVGYLTCFVGETAPDGWLLADGARVLIKDLPDLYAVIGDAYCPPVIDVELPPSIWESVRRLVGLDPRRRYKQASNHDYITGQFRLPSLQGNGPT